MSRRQLHAALRTVAAALANARRDGLVPVGRSLVLQRGCHRRANKLQTQAAWIWPAHEKAKARRYLRKCLEFLDEAIGVELADLNDDDSLRERIAAYTEVLDDQGSDDAVR